jgi:hypothetical protein
MSMSVTENQLIEALRVALQEKAQNGGDGFTGPELAKELRVHNEKARQLIREFMERDEIELTDLQRGRLNGYPYKLRGYRWKAPNG